MSATLHTLAGRRPKRIDPDREEASAKLAACTLRLHSHEPGSVRWRAAEANRDWWLAEVKRLNPGGAEIVPFPVPRRMVRKERRA